MFGNQNHTEREERFGYGLGLWRGWSCDKGLFGSLFPKTNKQKVGLLCNGLVTLVWENVEPFDESDVNGSHVGNLQLTICFVR